MSADFWRQVDVREMRECWLWKGAEANNYGFFRNETAHRFAWSFIYGEIPRGLFILHSCDTPLCVNPRHLRAGTHEENTLDKSVLSKVRSALADRDRIAALPAYIAIDTAPIHGRLKELRKLAGITQRQLALICGVHMTAVSHWENGLSAPKRDRLGVVAQALGVSVSALLGERSAA